MRLLQETRYLRLVLCRSWRALEYDAIVLSTDMDRREVCRLETMLLFRLYLPFYEVL